jgi:hypothetical protein
LSTVKDHFFSANLDFDTVCANVSDSAINMFSGLICCIHVARPPTGLLYVQRALWYPKPVQSNISWNIVRELMGHPV